VFIRDSVVQRAHWQTLGPTGPVRFIRFLSGFIFFLPFWLAGTAVLLFLRPRDTRWRLLIAFNYVTAVWLTAGASSTTRVAGSSLALHALTWMLVPVYLRLHLLVPAFASLRHRRNLWLLLYMLAAVLAALELLQLLPSSAYYLGLLLALAGSLLLLLLRSLHRVPSSARLAARLILAGVALAFGPALVLWLIPNLLRVSTRGQILTYLNFARK
jgi:hypothetical protein